MKTILSLIVGCAGCVVFSSCGGEPETHVYNWKVHKKPDVQYVKRPTSSNYKVGGGGTRYVGGYDTASGFRAAE